MKYYPEFWKCIGGSLPYKYGFGYWVGDLLCVNRKPKNPELELSPICDNRIKAVIGFIFKKVMLRR